MTRKHLLLSLSVILLLSLAAIGLWLYEIINVHTWASMSWLHINVLYSPYAGFLLACFAFLAPFVVNKQMTIKQFIFAVLILYPACFICYKTGSDISRMVLGRFGILASGDAITVMLVGILLFVLLAWVCWIITHRLIKPIQKKTMLWMVLLLFACIPLSSITIQINTGFGSGNNWIDAVKMGYPVFWMVFLLGVSGIILSRQKLE